jgi:hypothetical protein
MCNQCCKGAIGAVAVGLAVGVCIGLLIVVTWSTMSVTALGIAPPASLTATATPLPAQTPSPTRTPVVTSTPMPAPTAIQTARPKASQTSVATRPSTPTAGPRSITPHFLFGRPLAADAPAPAPNPVYLYGTTELGQYEVHHGVDFDRNPVGVPVFAVGNGTVVSAGDDRRPLCGEKGQTICGRFLNFYGLVAVIRLDQSYRGQTLYALYGHMSRIDVQVEQRVKRDDRIGAVGATGIAIGPHIQFEIRSGANLYANTRNPMLWIAPLPGRGVLAGRYSDASGKPIRGAIVDVYRAEQPTIFYRETQTYEHDEQPDVNADDEFGENWVMNDLPAGEFIVRVPGKPFAVRVNVPAGGLAFAPLGPDQ